MSDIKHLNAALAHLDSALTELGMLNKHIGNKHDVRMFASAISGIDRSDVKLVIFEIEQWSKYFDEVDGVA